MSKQTLITILLTAVIVGSGTYYFQSNYSVEKKDGSVNVEAPSSPSDTAEAVATMEKYSNDLYSVEYPSSYKLERIPGFDYDVVISGSKGSIEINTAGFFVPGPEASSDPEWELPKDSVGHGWDGDVSSALFYKSGDEATKNELKKIQESIELK